jgi:hypothetical protein
MSDGRFKGKPQAEPAVVDVLQRTLQSAKDGRITAIAIIVADRLQNVETAVTGDLSDARITNLLGGLTRAANKLLSLLEI